MRQVQWERMFPDELDAAFAARPIVYYPYGLCEPHGPQNAVGLDALKAHGICVKAARVHGGIVAPPDYWHIHEIGGYAIWSQRNVGEVKHWLTSMPPWQHFKNICYHIRTAEVLGFKGAIFFTGHYGPNWRDLDTLIELVQPHVRVRLLSAPEFKANFRGFDGAGKETGDHAGKIETSLLWALEPDCVDVSRFPPASKPAPHFAMGVSAREADRRVGERMVNDEIEWFGPQIAELLAAYDRAQSQPLHQPAVRTFADVERLWAEVIEPKVKDFRTMQVKWKDEDRPPEPPSVWAENAGVGGMGSRGDK